MRDLHAFNLYEHSRNSATDHLSPAIASPKEKVFIPACRNLVFLSLAGYLIPFQVVKYLMPTDVLIRTDALANISYYINFDDKGAISYHRISLWMSDWILMIGLCWLFLISGFSVYEIIKYHRLTRKLKKIKRKELVSYLESWM